MSFARNAATRNHDGSSVSANVRRFASQRTIVGPTDRETVVAAGVTFIPMGCGYDADGTTPIIAFYDVSNIRMVVVTGADAKAVFDSTPANGGSSAAGTRNVTSIPTGGTPSGDLMQGTVSGKRYLPRAGVVCHGAVIICCELYVDATGYKSSGIALVVSQDRGATWSVAVEEPSPYTEQNKSRGRSWMMQNWWPSGARTSAAPTTAWLPICDYLDKGGSPTTAAAFLVRMTRSGVGQAWTFGALKLIERLNSNVDHSHAAGVIDPGDNTLTFFYATGDGQDKNCVRRLTCADAANYASAAWTVQTVAKPAWAVGPANLEFHGARGAVGSRVMANQFVGCAPGPLVGEAFLGSDNSSHSIVKIDATAAGHMEQRHVLGSLQSEGRGRICFHIFNLNPQRGGPYIAVDAPENPRWTDSGGPVFAPRWTRVRYSDDGFNWVNVGVGLINGWSIAHIHPDGHIYINDVSGLTTGTGTGLLRVRVPNFTQRRPLLIAPGGDNYQRPYTALGNSGANIVVTSKTRSQVVAETGEEPPCEGPFWHVRVTNETVGSGSTISFATPGNSATNYMPDLSGYRRRTWFYPVFAGGDLYLNLGKWPGFQVRMENAHIAEFRKWIPCDLSGKLLSGEQQYTDHFVTLVNNVNEFYLGHDFLCSDERYGGYAMPNAAANGLPTNYPHEIETIGGLACAPEAWTIGMSLRIPEDGVDSLRFPTSGHHAVAMIRESATRFVLVRLHGGADASALPGSAQKGKLSTLIVTDGVIANGVAGPEITGFEALRGSPISFVLTYTSGVSMTLTGHVGNSEIKTNTAATAVVDLAPTDALPGHDGVAGPTMPLEMASLWCESDMAISSGEATVALGSMFLESALPGGGGRLRGRMRTRA